MKGLRTAGVGTIGLLAALALTGGSLLVPRPARAASAAEIENNARVALENLYSTSPEAKMLGREARAILVFPSIIKAGFLFGGQYGDGAMFERGRTVGYYNSAGVSYGLQAGVESFSYALFFMTEGALNYLRARAGRSGPAPMWSSSIRAWPNR